MKTLLLAASAAALLCGVAPVAAQSAGATGGAGMLCSDLTAMEPAAQTAFLQGYWSGHMDAMGSTGTDSSAAAAATPPAAGSEATETAAAGATTEAPDAAAGADATATGSTAAPADSSAAAPAADAAAGTAFDPNAILTACTSAPTSTISDVIGSGMTP